MESVRDTVFIPVAAYKEDEVESKLALEYILNKPFNSIFGKLKSIKPVIWLLNYDNFNPIYLTKPMTPRERTNWFKSRRKRYVPNSTEIFKLVVTDRLLSDKDLLQSVAEKIQEVSNGNTEQILFVPYIKIKRGIITTETPNKNLRIYGVVLTRVIRFIMDEFKDTDIRELSKEEFHERKLKIKEKVWEDVQHYAKDHPILNNLLEGMEISDDELKERFMR